MALWPAFYGDADRCYSSVYDCDHGPTPDLNFAYESGELDYYKSSAYYTDDSFTVYTYSEPKMLQYDPIDQYHSYNYYESCLNPYETNYIQPKLLQYEPSPPDYGYFPSETKFTISYSSVEFNEPEFEEHDPTPYGGGYDPVTTYGKPLPPSETTCYPRTVPQSDNTSTENFSFSSIPSPYGGKDDHLPTTKPPTEDKVSSEAEADMIPRNDSPRPYEDEIGLENESEKQVVPQFSYGSGLEAVDLCESIFGYWPCLAKQAKNKCQSCDQEVGTDPWDQRAADYLFGTPIVYDYQNYQH